MRNEDLKGDIGLEIDVDAVQANEFRDAVEAFLGLVSEVTKHVNKGQAPRAGWATPPWRPRRAPAE